MKSLDTSLEAMLRKPETPVGDDGFSDRVMRALPRRARGGSNAGRWTLGGAAVAGGLLGALLGAPLQNAFGSLAIGGGSSIASVLAVIVVALVAVPTVWAFYSR